MICRLQALAPTLRRTQRAENPRVEVEVEVEVGEVGAREARGRGGKPREGAQMCNKIAIVAAFACQHAFAASRMHTSCSRFTSTSACQCRNVDLLPCAVTATVYNPQSVCGAPQGLSTTYTVSDVENAGR